MKLSNVFAKLTCMKSNAVRVLAAATLAGAVLTAAAPAAEAQQFSAGVRFGGPQRYASVVVAPAYGYAAPRYDDRRFVEERQFEAQRHYFEERRAREEWMRHEQWERYHRFHDGFGGGRPY